jgi:uncharacterized protein YbjT (DUF2867 family)
MALISRLASFLAFAAVSCSAFTVPGSKASLRTTHVFAQEPHDISSSEKHDDASQGRRDFLTIAAGASTLPFFLLQPVLAREDGTSTPAGSICVIGANGKTGSECVGACLARGINVVATSRGGEYTGVYNTEENKDKGIQSKVCDVTIPSTVLSAIKGSRAVIFAASSSKAGGTPAAVDNLGLVNVAKACIEYQIPHLVVVSSGAVTKPDSPVFKFLNIFGKIMEEKIKGEDTLRDMFKNVNGSTYTVIRPGGLTEEPGKGVGALELNQGDSKSGRISRSDVASLCIEATNYPKDAGGTTFECYDTATGKPLQTVGISNILKQKNSGSNVVFVSGKERIGATWADIFTGLEKDS